MDDLLEPIAAIRAHMAGFPQAVDLESFGTRDPQIVAGLVNDFCESRLGAGVAG